MFRLSCLRVAIDASRTRGRRHAGAPDTPPPPLPGPVAPTSRLRVRQKSLKVLHQIVVTRRAAVFQQIIPDLVQGQLTGRRHFDWN